MPKITLRFLTNREKAMVDLKKVSDADGAR